MEPTFVAWPKIARLNREIVITEKLDGTNAAIGIVRETVTVRDTGTDSQGGPDITTTTYRVYAQSRNRIITPGKGDNMGFAGWVEKHKVLLAEHLGEGLHFGEWWGVSIGRTYDLSERRFSLFNTKKWERDPLGALALANLRLNGVAVYAVPILYEGPWTGVFGYKDATEGAPEEAWLKPEQMQDWDGVSDQPNPRPRFAPNFIVEYLKRVGSQAAPGYMKPEGIVVYHKAGDVCFKVTCEKDEQYKGQA